MFTRRVRHRNTLNAHMMSTQPLMGGGEIIHPVNTLCQHTPSTHPLLKHPINTSYQLLIHAHMMSTQPLMGGGDIIHPVNTLVNTLY